MSVENTHLFNLLQSALRRYPVAGELWLGYSGGLDSSVLLHLLAAHKTPVHALYVNHGLSPRADEWQAHCKAQARAMGVRFSALRVQVDPAQGGVEQGARIARYQAFEQALAPGDQILLAHHGDDQVETFLLRLLRGAGVLGLAGMAEYREFAPGKALLRPLLAATRPELESYAQAHRLSWIEDESNSDLDIDRNYLRSQVVPGLAGRWPVAGRVARAAENLRESATVLEEVAAEDLRACDCRDERFGQSVSLDALNGLSMARRKNLLRGWLLARTRRTPDATHLDQLLAQLTAVQDAQPAIGLAGLVARRYRDRLFLTPQLQPLVAAAEAGGEWQWDGVSDLKLPGGWVLSPSSGWPAGEYLVRFRRGGERARPSARQHSQTLKKLLQEYALEPWLRDLVPLVFRGERLLAVGDLFVTAGGPPQPPFWRFFD